MSAAVGGASEPALSDDDAHPASASARISGAGRNMPGLSAKSGELAQRLESFEGAAAGRGRRNGEEIADIQQDFEHELVTLEGIIEVPHAGFGVRRLGLIVGFTIDGFEIREDSVAGSHCLWSVWEWSSLPQDPAGRSRDEDRRGRAHYGRGAWQAWLSLHARCHRG